MRESLRLSSIVGGGYCLREKVHGLERPLSAKRRSRFPVNKKRASMMVTLSWGHGVTGKRFLEY